MNNKSKTLEKISELETQLAELKMDLQKSPEKTEPTELAPGQVWRRYYGDTGYAYYVVVDVDGTLELIGNLGYSCGHSQEYLGRIGYELYSTAIDKAFKKALETNT